MEIQPAQRHTQMRWRKSLLRHAEARVNHCRDGAINHGLIPDANQLRTQKLRSAGLGFAVSGRPGWLQPGHLSTRVQTPTGSSTGTV